MTTYVNGFDSGVNGNAVTTSSVASSGYGYHIGGSAATTFTAADTIDGALAIEMSRATSGRTLNIFTNSALATLDVSFSMMFTCKAALPNANDYLWDVRNGTPGSICRMLINGSTGVPFIQIAGVTATGAVASVSLAADTQYRLDARVHISGSVGYIFADFFTPYGSSPLANLGFALTGKNLGTVNIVDINLGPSAANTVSVGTTVIDLCRINDAQSTSYWGSPVGIDSGSATLAGAATMTVTAHPTRFRTATLAGVATMTTVSTSTGPLWDDTRFKWDDLALQWDGGGIGPGTAQAILTATSTMTVTATDTPGVYVPPLLGNLDSKVALAGAVTSTAVKAGTGKLTVVGGT